MSVRMREEGGRVGEGESEREGGRASERETGNRVPAFLPLYCMFALSLSWARDILTLWQVLVWKMPCGEASVGSTGA